MIAFTDMHRGQFGAWAICRILGATECGFITDVFSWGIVGWAVAPTLHTQQLPLLALEHALFATGVSRNGSGLIHHCDRGVNTFLSPTQTLFSPQV